MFIQDNAGSPGYEPWENVNVTTHAVIVHAEPEGGYWAEVPALPGCYSQGDTMPELMDNVKEAMAGVVAVVGLAALLAV